MLTHLLGLLPRLNVSAWNTENAQPLFAITRAIRSVPYILVKRICKLNAKVEEPTDCRKAGKGYRVQTEGLGVVSKELA